MNKQGWGWNDDKLFAEKEDWEEAATATKNSFSRPHRGIFKVEHYKWEQKKIS